MAGQPGASLIFLIFASFNIWTIVITILYLNGEASKTYAGILSVIFGGIFAGFLIIADDNEKR